MKKFLNILAIKREIDSYEKHFVGAPLLIGVDGSDDYTTLFGLLKDDYGKQIIRMSDSCSMDFPPDPAFQISLISNAAKLKPVVWVGAAQAKMLYGQQQTEQFLINLLGSSFGGPVIVLCPFCCNMLESIARNYTKLGYHIVVASNKRRDISEIYVNSKEVSYFVNNVVHGIKELLQRLEDGRPRGAIHLVTTCKLSYLSNSMYPVSEGISPYQALCQREAGIAAYTGENIGTAEQWRQLAHDMNNVENLSVLCENRLCSVKDLQTNFGDYLSSDADTQFLCFLCLKVFYSKDDSYLSYCLRNANCADNFKQKIFTSILDVAPDDKKFASWIRQRKRILSSLDENSAMMKDFCAQAAIKGKDVLWYISDRTEEERAALLRALCNYSYTPDELDRILGIVSPQLAAYMQLFTFDEFNTKVMESDAFVRGLLTEYFQRYKIQKLTNHQDRDFIEFVEKEAKIRSFTKLQARAAIVKKLDKAGAQPYFFDSLGAEFLAFIRSRAEAYGMQFECFIGRCNLPSITSKNKEFYDAFPKGSVLKEEGLDELKHRGTKYDFQFTTEPLHIFDELAILDRNIKKMGSLLAMERCQKIIILSDHGSSRLAVTYRSENDKLELPEHGQHSGRCCPIDADPGIEFATFEDGFAVLANYERFKGSRKADVETHGGASLEETVIPVIILTLKPKEQQIYFVETVVFCSLKEGSNIRMFANPPLKKPRMVINGKNYDGRFDGDKHNIVFEMPELKRKGHHEAEIYDGGVKVALLTFETRRQTGTNQLF